MEPAKLDDTVIALLFAADEPISARKIAGVVEDADTAMVNESLDRLMVRFATELPSIVLEHVAGGFQLSTNAAYSEFLARLYSGRRKQRLSKAGMETLAIIAYRQPLTRADIESVRGVGCGGVVTTLMERSLIRIVGKAKVLGAPFLYGTTHEFLEYLGLDTLKDLPSIEELEALLAKEEASHSAPEQSDQGSAHEATDDEWTDETGDLSEASLSTGDSGEAAHAATVEPWTTESPPSEKPPKSSDNKSQKIPVDERDA
ncbi:MAG: SMC-Scp complex subunit ScpB [bacterium]|nr:SMC-Scp complex subunit ScpB [bacterium]